MCEDGIRIPTPIGDNCELCVTAVTGADQGTFIGAPLRGRAPVHRECMLRSVVGGIGHLRDHDLWCEVRNDPDAGMSFRQSALEVWRFLELVDELPWPSPWRGRPTLRAVEEPEEREG